MSDLDETHGWQWNLYPREPSALAEFLRRSGRPVNCRLDLRMTSMVELRWTAKILADLARDLQTLAWDERYDEILRLLQARDKLDSARISLRYSLPKVTKKPASKPRAGKGSTTTYSVSRSGTVGVLDKPGSRPEMRGAKKES